MTKTLYAVMAISFVVIAAVALSSTQSSALEYQGEMYQTDACGCCDVWGTYAQRSIDLDITQEASINSIKDEHNIPQHLRSCHTTIIEGYFVEGHIPIQAIEKLLDERPDIAGIALPGMPSGTPGMPGPKTQDWVVHAVNHDSSSYEFMRI